MKQTRRAVKSEIIPQNSELNQDSFLNDELKKNSLGNSNINKGKTPAMMNRLAKLRAFKQKSLMLEIFARILTLSGLHNLIIFLITKIILIIIIQIIIATNQH